MERHASEVKLPRRLIEAAERSTTPAQVGGGLAMLLIIGMIDFWTGPQFDLSIFYLLPISLAAWIRGLVPGLILSLLAAISWFTARMMAVPNYSHPLVPLWNVLTLFGFFALAAYTISAVRRLKNREEERAHTDLLTGLPDGRGFDERAGQQVLTALRYGRPLTAACIGIDQFKLLNARFGRHTGDEVLISIGQILTQALRTSDIVARLGGDQFAVLLPETDAEHASPALAKLQQALRSGTDGWPITFSIGAVTCSHLPCPYDLLMTRAEEAMFRVKENGGDDLLLETLDSEATSAGEGTSHTTSRDA